MIFNCCSIVSAEDQDIAEQYAPEFYFEASETCFPVTVQYQIDSSFLYCYDEIKIEIDNNPTASSLAFYSSPSDNNLFLDNQKGTISDDGIINDYQNKLLFLGYSIYYRLYSSSNIKVIQYWVFYAFNKGEVNQHEGDWEMVQIYLSQDEPTYVMYSQHEGGQKATWQQAEKTNNHIKVYVARGSHANYLRSYSGKLGVASDIVNSNGKILRLPEYQLIPLANQTWLPFAGRWGEINSLEDTFLGKSGPYGPMYRQEGQMWNTPDTWGMNLPSANNYVFFFEFFLYHFVTIFIGIVVLSFVLIFLRLYKQYKKTGFGPRIFSFFYMDSLNLKSIGNILFIGGIIIAIIAVFFPWYTISADIPKTEFNMQGIINYLTIDGNGIHINYSGSKGPIPIGTLALPFGIIIAIGIVITLIKTIGVSESRSLGKKYLWKGIRYIMLIIILVISVAILGNIYSMLVLFYTNQISITQLFSSLSLSPFGGSETITLSESGVMGTVTMHWGVDIGGFLFILAGILIVIAGLCERRARTTFFIGNKKRS